MYPILLNLEDKSVLVVGAGRIALRKVKQLLKEGARVTIWSLDFLDEFKDLDVTCIHKAYEPTQGEFDLIFACTNDTWLNQRIKEEEKTFVNNVSNKQISDFYNMGSFTWNGLDISITSQGNTPSRVKKISAYIKKQLEEYDDEAKSGI